MTITPRLRKFALTAHVTFSIGWVGAVAAFLPLVIVGVTGQDAQTVRAADLTMELVGWFVLVPFSLGALLTGVIQALGTKWGLFRYYWVLVKLLLTIVATLVLLDKVQAMSYLAGETTSATVSSADLHGLRIELLGHAVGGLVVLLTATVLAVYKPWGRTRYGRRKQHEAAYGGAAVDAATPARPQPIEST